MKELAEFTRLRRADAPFPSQSLMHMAALPENGLEVPRRFPGVFQEKPEFLRGGAIVRRERVTSVVVLYQQGQQAQKFGFFCGTGAAFADQVAESAGDLVILRLRLNHLGQDLNQ
jgi:hypothetical protein